MFANRLSSRFISGLFNVVVILSLLVGAVAFPNSARAASAWTMIDLGTLGGNYSQAIAINETGQVIGISLTTGNAQQHAFVWQGGVMTDLGTLGGSHSNVKAINESGQVTGYANTASGHEHAFLWENGVMTDLGTLGSNYSYPVAINEAGQILGYSGTAGGQQHAFIWQDGVMTDLGTLGGDHVYPIVLSEAGQVAGYAYTPDNKQHAFIWESGVMTDLGTLGGDYSNSKALNEAGQVVGNAYTADDEEHAFIWEGGVMTDLGGSYSRATAINDVGQVIGQVSLHAFVWEGGVMTDLGTLGGSRSDARAINEAGQVIGYSTIADNVNNHAFLWEGGVMTDLGTLGGSYSDAIAINENGQVTGISGTAGNAGNQAFVWEDGVMTDLGTFGGNYSQPFAINEAGQIIGNARTAIGEQHAFIAMATLMTTNQTITVTTSAPSSARDGSTFAVGATASSGLPVSFNSSGACTNIGPDFTMTSGTGECTVIYDQAGDSSYNPALQITEVVTALPALLDQTITVITSAPASATMGEVFTVEATASSGLPVSYETQAKGSSCTNVGATFTMISGIGDCIVVYYQDGDEIYNYAPVLKEVVADANDTPVIEEGDLAAVTISQDGDPIPFSLTLNATDADANPITWSISTLAGHGTAAIDIRSCKGGKPSGGKAAEKEATKDVKGSSVTQCPVLYTPTTGYFGTDSFDVQVSDGGLTDTITVNVTIEKTNTSVVTLLDSQGNGLAGATVQYYSSGWQSIPGSTDADGELSYDGLGLSGNVTFRISYANASIQKQQNITNDPEVIFQTQLVSMQLLASDGSTELNGDAQYYSNGWRTFGGGSTSASMELLPLNYTFRVSYGGASIQKQQNIANDTAVIFQTKLASMQLLASDGTTELPGTGQYYANGWKTFGNGSTSATMELLPVNYTFRISYGGASIQKQQDVNVDATVLFQTKLVSMQLLASDGTTELTGTSEYYANGWKTFGSGSTSATMELLPVNYTFRVSYGGASIQKQQDVNADAAVLFQTKLASMQLLASDGTTELAGTGEYYANGWKTFGSGSTSATMELLPVNYTFRVSYGGASIQKQQNVSSDPAVLFQTKLVTMKLLASDGTTELPGTGQYYANGWKNFANGSTPTSMELLPVNYTFRVSYSGASVQKQQDVNIDPLVIFQTGQVHSNSATTTQYYANGWKAFTQDMELLPGSYAFKFNDGTPQTTYPLSAGIVNSIH